VSRNATRADAVGAELLSNLVPNHGTNANNMPIAATPRHPRCIRRAARKSRGSGNTVNKSGAVSFICLSPRNLFASLVPVHGFICTSHQLFQALIRRMVKRHKADTQA
jgi:hypothetical protein